MSYLDALGSELASAGIPSRRRRRILAEVADHLEENPNADIGAPRDLARQFADELGTRVSRRTASGAVAALAVAALFLIVMFVTGGRQHGWVGYAGRHSELAMAWWWEPLQVVCLLAAQVAFASGLLAVLRAYRLRREPTISAADATVINRRTAIALLSGAVTMVVLPLTRYGTYLGVPRSDLWWSAARYGGVAAVGLLLVLLVAVLSAARLRPQLDGAAADLTADLGTRDARVTPERVAYVLCAAIVVALTILGIASDDPYDGLARGLLDAGACMAGFIVLGRYLGLRTTG